MTNECVLKIENLNKNFGITHANKNICLELRKGEIRAIAGENGCGKSTLLSQIAGIYKSDSGVMYKDGKVYEPKSPMDACANKIAIIVQELGLITDLPAGVNVFLGRTNEFSKFGFVNVRKIYAAANEVLKKWELPSINFRKSVGGMNVENRKMIELARALSMDPDILILDEVTQSLSQDNRQIVYKLIEKFRNMGRSILLISHDIEETIAITDTITVLRDGEVVATVESATITEDDLKKMMVGREIGNDYYRADEEEIYEEEVIFSFQDVSTKSGLDHLNFEIHKGEILAFCGLSDSGIHDVGQVAYGLEKAINGKVLLHPNKVVIDNPNTALVNRMAYVPKDRDDEALMMQTTIQNNMCLPSNAELLGKFGYMNPAAMKKLAEDAKSVYNVKCTTVNQNMNSLSGGNKQKVNLGRWLSKDLQLLIIDCPTRGVDVGVKAYIYSCMKEAKQKGISMLLITDELTEAIGMADNIIVMRNGAIKKKIGRSSHYNEEEMIKVMI